jgi:hypothetical protein
VGEGAGLDELHAATIPNWPFASRP